MRAILPVVVLEADPEYVTKSAGLPLIPENVLWLTVTVEIWVGARFRRAPPRELFAKLQLFIEKKHSAAPQIHCNAVLENPLKCILLILSEDVFKTSGLLGQLTVVGLLLDVEPVIDTEGMIKVANNPKEPEQL